MKNSTTVVLFFIMNRLTRKFLGWLKIAGLAFTIISGSAFVASGTGLIFHATQKEASFSYDQPSQKELKLLKAEKDAGLGLIMLGSFIGLGKFYLTIGTKYARGLGPTSKKLAQKIKSVYKNDIEQE